ncbi:MAG: RuvX/YqgF family protein [Patescibacteria group bacterium]|nr:RuvX/YqgF family protein [Patescibacteria group bacterium]
MTPKNFLGIDYGSKHCGLAISLDRNIPLGLDVFSGKIEEVEKRIKIFIQENAIEVVVVGVPESKVHGGRQTKEIMKFIDRLQKELPGVDIKTADEKMTTKLANRYAEKEKEHQEAARIILEDWMTRQGLLNS